MAETNCPYCEYIGDICPEHEESKMVETKQEVKPGKWKIGYADGSGLDTITCNDEAQAEVWDRDGKGPERAWMICRAVNNFEGMLEALEAARKFVRGRHSTLTYGPQKLLDQIDEAIRAAKQGR